MAAVDRTEVAIRHGHMYAYRLCQALDLDPEDGVVRASLVPYNTAAEVERLIEVLEDVLCRPETGCRTRKNGIRSDRIP